MTAVELICAWPELESTTALVLVLVWRLEGGGKGGKLVGTMRLRALDAPLREQRSSRGC